MSLKKRVGGTALGATPAVVGDDRKKTTAHALLETLAVPAAAALDKMLDMLGNLSERTFGMKSSKFEQVDRQRKKSSVSNIFGSALGAGKGTYLQVSERTPPHKHSLNVSPDPFFGARRPSFARNIVVTPAQDRGDYVMNAGPAIEVKDALLSLNPEVGAPGPTCFHKYQVTMGVHDGRQRKLALQPFDGMELYHGLISAFIERDKELGRQVNFTERVCGFVYP
uniref:Uncharacterized protein n=1 Tax=Peronospora matthiolae TaxID=2874970 RepID=A0AAV1UNP6_9STRA